MSIDKNKVEEGGESTLNMESQDDKSSLAKIANPATLDDDFIPQWVYDSLPTLLKDSCKVFNDKYERDIFLTATLAVFGGCFHNLYAYNEPDKKKVAANLLAIIVGPSASGKGALNYARKMAKQIKETFAENSKKPDAKNGNKLFIPANISSAGMIQILAKNNGVGVMVESEIDTIVNANRQEWGNYSEIIRKSFENEEYSMYRKGKDRSEFYEIESLELSIAISGTANQFKQLIYSSENGLFSRGTYYVFNPYEEKFKFLGRMTSNVTLDSKFASFAKIANDYYELHLVLNEVAVVFTEDQLSQIGKMLQSIKDRHGDILELDANIKRGFIMAQKIAATLTFLYACETGSLQETLTCTQETLKIVLLLTLIYQFHAYNAYELLPSKGTVNLNSSQQRLLSVLPEEFTKPEAIDIGVDNGLSQRAAYYAIKALERKGLIKLMANGKYRKQ